jgi:serine/threonine protein kinase
MHPVTEPVEQQPQQGGDGRTAKEWLDSLAGGGCDLHAFLRGAAELLQRTPDAGWDLLALVDQYYRRGKISAEAFGTIKSHLQALLVGKGQRDLLVPAMNTTPVAVPKSTATRRSARLQKESGQAQEASLPPESRQPRGQPQETRQVPAAQASPEPALEPAQAHPAEESGRPARPPAVGDVLRGRYVVQELLGQGGMGTVFAAIDQYRVERPQGEQRVALKVLHTDVIKRPRLFTELRREFQHLQSLSHPNIVRVHEFDHDGDLAFFTMEYLSGCMLSRLLTAREAALPRPFALAILRDVGAAIAHAHSRGVVHGDLNPGNIFITDAGEVRVFDFGASHQLRRGPLVTELDTPDQVAVATPLYASCQVLEGATATTSDDIYALACVAYLLLAGDHPFHDVNALKARSARLKPARPGGLHSGQWRALKAGLQFDRERRPTDTQAWLAQLDLREAAPHLPVLARLSAVRPSRPYDIGRWMQYAALTVLIGLCGWWTNQHYDAVVGGAAGVQTRIKSWFDFPGLSQWWDRSRVLGRKPDPVIDYPADSDASAPPDQSTPALAEAPAAPVASRPAAAVALRTPPPAAPQATMPAPAAVLSAPIAVASTAAPTTAAARATAAAPATTPAATATPYTGPKAHLELASDTVEVLPTDSVAHLVVRRTRSSRGEVSFTWWTESGTALPGRDFTAVPAHVETINNGQNAVTLNIPVVANPARQVPRNFYVVIDQPSDNATVGPRTLSMVSLVGAN